MTKDGLCTEMKEEEEEEEEAAAARCSHCGSPVLLSDYIYQCRSHPCTHYGLRKEEEWQREREEWQREEERRLSTTYLSPPLPPRPDLTPTIALLNRALLLVALASALGLFVALLGSLFKGA